MSASTQIIDAEKDSKSSINESYDPEPPEDDYAAYVLEDAKSSDVSTYAVDVVLHDGSGKQPAGVEISYEYRANNMTLRNQARRLKQTMMQKDYSVEWKKDGRCKNGESSKGYHCDGPRDVRRWPAS